jgi:uncharacterized protein
MLTESTLDPAAAFYRKVIAAGDHWVHLVKAGQHFRILDLEGNQAADTLFYNAHDPEDRYAADVTIRRQGSLYLTTGSSLMSTGGTTPAHDRGRYLRPPRHPRRSLLARIKHDALRP